jgi:type I restriction enzyme S subunit
MIKVVLQDIVEKPITGEWGNEGGTVKVLRTTNFTNNGYINYEKVVLRDIDQKKVESKKLLKGDLIIEKSGGSPTQPVGRVVYFESDEIFLCNNFTAILRPKKEKVFPKYLHYILFVGHQFGLTSAFQNKTTGIINLQLPKYLENLQIPLPPLETQQKIASILDAADTLRQKDKALLAKYDELTQALFLDMFGDTWVNPKKWKEYLVEELASKEKNSIKAGPFGSSLKKEFYVKKGYKIYGQEQVIKDDMSFGNYYIDEKKYKELENCKVKTGDILISLVGTYGKISVIPHVFEEGIINPRLMKITPDEKIIRPDFLKILLQGSASIIQMKNQSRGGTMDIVNVGIMRKIKLPVPPIALQTQFSERVAIIEQQKAIAHASLEKSEQLFNSLLQKAFKGELV